MVVRRYALLGFCLLLLHSIVAAQDTRTYITADEHLQFNYPTGWHIREEGNGLVFVTSNADLLGESDYFENDVVILLVYEQSESWALFFADFDTSQPIEAVSTDIFAAIEAKPAELLPLGDAAIYTVEPSGFVEDPKSYITRTDRAGVVFINAYFDESNDMQRSQVEAFVASLVAQPVAIPVTTIPEEASFVLAEVSPFAMPEPTTCDALMLAQTEILPMRELILYDTPRAILDAGTRAYLELDDGTQYDVVITDYPNDGFRSVSVPLIEGNLYNDTPATLHIVDAGGTPLCPTQPFSILALPPAPNALNDTITQLGDILAMKRQEFGVTTEFLRPESSGTLTPELFALALMQYAYDDPNNPNALVRIADGTAPLVQDPTFDRNLADSIIAATLAPENLAMQRRVIHARLNPNPSGFMLVSTNHAPRNAQFGDSLKVSIDNFETLTSYMEIQQSAFGGQSSAQVYNEVALLNSLASFATGPIGVAIGAVMYVGKLVNDAALNLLPSEITQLNLNYDGDIPHEDDEVIYQYTHMRVNAKSQGWNLKYVIIDGTLMFTGFSTRFEAIELNATTVIQTGGEVGSNLTSRVDVPDPNATGSAAEVMQVVDNFVTIPPFVWEDIPVRFEDIASVRVIAPPSATTPAIEIVSTQDGSYRAINEGRVYLRFEVVAGRKSLYLSKPIQVARIDVTWNQQTNVIINEGETVCFEAQINNALNTDGRFTIDGPSGIDTVETTEQPAQYC